MKIAFIHNNFPAGGAERITVDIADYLKTIGGYEVYVYASRISESLLADERSRSYILRRIPTQAIPSRRTRQIERLIIEDGINVLVQVVKSIPGIEGIKQRTGVKTVVACHGEPFWQRHAIMHRRQKGLLNRMLWCLWNKRRFADGTLAMRMAVERTWRDYKSSDAYVVLCEAYRAETAERLGIAVEDSHIHAIENPEYPVKDVNYDKENIILFVGRFENWSKRIDRLMRIWHSVQDRMPDWQLVLVGDGTDYAQIRQMAIEMQLKRVTFEGRHNNVTAYYRKASVVALTSETEGWPLALTEAQAQGCVCVAFGCTSGVSDVLSPSGECGFLLPAFDEEQYAETLMRISTMDDAECRQIRKNAVAKRSGHAPEIIAEKWRHLFARLING